MLTYVLALCVAVLLWSNLWLLREIERLRRHLRIYQKEVARLDEQISRLSIQVDLLDRSL